MMVRVWLTLFASLLALSPATGQEAEAASDALIVRALAPELRNVQLGRMETLDENQRRKIAGEEHIGFRFERDLDSDGRQELILLGSYASGDTRRSFALIAKPDAGAWVRSQVLTFSREFVIGLGYDNKNRLAVNFCTGCDSGGWIQWTGSAYEFTRYPEPGVPGVK